jgi:hypothetical protein
MKPPLRRLGLALHIALSVGWLGAVAAFLTLAMGSLSRDEQLARACYLSMLVVARGALVPLSIGTVVSGVVQSLGTKWGLFRHWWVLVKLVLAVLSTAALLLHEATAIKDAAKLAAEAGATALQAGRLREIGIQLLADASAAALVLVAALTISIYKPWGVVGRVTRGLRVFIAAVCALVMAFVMLHLSGHSPHRHSH